MSDARGSREPKEMRVALVTNFCPHYRRPLFLELSRRVDLTLIMTSRGNEWYWQGERPFDTGQVPAERAPRAFDVRQLLHRGDYEAVVTDLTGRATLLATVGTARRLKVPVVLWVGIWEHPRTLAHRVSRPLARKLYRSADAIVTYGSHVSAFVQRESGRTQHVFVAPQAVENERFRAPAPSGALRAIRSRLGLDDRPTFTFVGRVTEEKGWMSSWRHPVASKLVIRSSLRALALWSSRREIWHRRSGSVTASALSDTWSSASFRPSCRRAMRSSCRQCRRDVSARRGGWSSTKR